MHIMARKLLFAAWLICQVVGFIFASYGVLRESFANIATKTGFGDGRFGEGPYGGGLTNFNEVMVKIGTAICLLPGDRTLTIVDHKRNATFAVVGVLLIGASIILDIILRVLPEG
jgi:hypothetical protein